MSYLFLFFISLAFAGRFEEKNLLEKTFTHDNTFCMLNGKRVEFELRSFNKFTEPKEKNYGEFAFFRPNKKLKPLPINKDHMHSYRFFPGTDSLCSKSLGYKLDSDTSAILYLRENRPYKGKLVIQLYDHKKHEPKEVLETDFATDEVLPSKDGFAFKVMPERHDIDMGRVKIKDVEYTYQDRDFYIWMNYNLAGFQITPSLTFEKFAWKEYFKTEEEFQKAFNWSPSDKNFSPSHLYIAVNHKLKKECLLISSEKIKVNGSEGWRCK